MKQILIIILSAVATFPAFARQPAENAISTLYTSNELVSSAFNCIMQDQQGFIWIGTENGLNRFDGYRFSAYTTIQKDTTTIVDNDVTALFNDSQGRIFVGCNRGLAEYVFETNNFRRFRFPNDSRPRITSMIEDRWGNLLICTAGFGIFILRKDEKELKALEVTLPDDAAFGQIFLDARGDVWVAGYAGTTMTMRWNGSEFSSPRTIRLDSPILSMIDSDVSGFTAVCRNKILRYNSNQEDFIDTGYDLSALGEIPIKMALRTSKNDILFGATNNGMWVIHEGEKEIRRVKDSNKVLEIAAANIIDVIEDKKCNLWICCHNKGLYEVETGRDNIFRNISFSQENIILGSGVTSIVHGDRSDYLVAVSNHVFRFSDDGRITPCNGVPYGTSMIQRDSDGGYWLAAENSLFRFDPYKGTSRQVMTFPGQGVMCMANNADDELFVCNFGRGFTIFNTKTGKTEAVRGRFEQENGLDNAWVLSMFCDKDDQLWIGTADGLECRVKGENLVQFRKTLKGVMCSCITETSDGKILVGTRNGLYVVDKNSFEAVAVEDVEGLENLNIKTMTHDDEGNLWLGCTNGLWKLDRDRREIVKYFVGRGTIADEFVSAPAIKNPDGSLTLAVLDGITTFRPAEVDQQKVSVDEVKVTNMLVDGNTVSFEFSLFDFHNTHMTTFQYTLDVAGEKWTSVPIGLNSVSFANLAPGSYSLRIRAIVDGEYSPVSTVRFKVRAPFYATTTAYIIYFCIVGLLIFLGVRRYISDRRKKMDEAKMQFLINATHEIRSPLTLILSPLSNLKARITDRESRIDIDTIERSTNRLLSLINDILDIRKIDKNQMQLRFAHTEMSEYVGAICKMYQYAAHQRNITLRFRNLDDNDVFAWIDRANFDKIIANLLSNALKFTPDGGFINVKLSSDKKRLSIEVNDSGEGLPGNPDRLFERFYQGKNSRNSEHAGSGIGLNLCKTLVTMHGGKITAHNRPDQHGAVFVVTIPLDNAHLRQEDIVSEKKEEMTENEAVKIKKLQNVKKYRVLLVDDDADVIEYLTRELQNVYHVETCGNGKDALALLLKDKFDLVVSDVIMPEMDGFTMLKNIKNNPNICEIPVVMLTTKAEAQDRMKGMRIGSDSYLAKPFSIGELEAVMESLLANRRRLQGKFSGAHSQKDRVENVEVTDNNKKLMDRIMKAVNKNLANPEYNIEELAESVGLSRSQLHRKIKEITGLSSGTFVRNIRLEQAARLLKENKDNVSQIAYLVGFVSIPHFSTVFKKYYGMTPKEYAES